MSQVKYLNKHTAQGYIYSVLYQLKLLSNYKTDIGNIKKTNPCLCVSTFLFIWSSNKNTYSSSYYYNKQHLWQERKCEMLTDGQTLGIPFICIKPYRKNCRLK